MKVNIEEHQNEKEILVSVTGEIDAYTAPKLREELLPLTEGKNKVITVNLKDVSYLDSTGLGVFVGMFKQLNKNEGELRLVELSDRLKRLFKITGLSHIMSISDKTEDGGTMKHVMDYVEMKIPAKPEYVGVIRLTISGIASTMGYTYEQIEDIKIAVSEACTNAVQHAYPDEEGGEVIVGFGIYEDKLETMVADSGQSFNFIQTKEELGPYTESSTVDQLTEGGLGLYLIETLMDEVRVSNTSGVTVFMVKYLGEERENHDKATSDRETN